MQWAEKPGQGEVCTKEMDGTAKKEDMSRRVVSKEDVDETRANLRTCNAGGLA
jgi:hypothetical protein